MQVLQLDKCPSHYEPQPTVWYMANMLSCSKGSLAHKSKPELQKLDWILVTGDRRSPQTTVSDLVLPSSVHRSKGAIRGSKHT